MKSLIASSLLAFAASALFLAVGSTSANAADYTWDTVSGDGTTITAGSGNWNTTAGNTVWNNGTTNVIWAQTSGSAALHNAIFAGADGTHTVTLSGITNAQSVAFNNSGYTLTSGTLTLRPTTTTSGSITVAAGKTATVNSNIAFNDNKPVTITSNAGSTLNLGGGASNSQYTFAGAGTVNMTAGSYTANVGGVKVATFNQTGGTFNMNMPISNLGQYSIGNAAGQSVTYTMLGSAIINANSGSAGGTNAFLAIGRGAGNTAYSNTLNVTGSANLNVGNNSSGRPGELLIASDNLSNGTLNVTGGAVTVGGTATGYTDNKIYFFKNGSGAGYTANLTQSGGTVTAVNGIQFGGTAGTYSGTANLTLSSGVLYVGAQGITRGSGASTLPIAIKLQGGVIGAFDNWSSSFDMKLGTAGAGSTFQAATSGGVSKNITLSGVLSDDTSVSGKLTKTGAGTLTLSGSNTYTGETTVNAGTLAMGASDVLPDATNVTIGAATLNAATFTDTAGTLDVTAANSTINLGSGATLAFADSSVVDWTGGTLNITGTFVPGSSLRFGTTSGGLTSAQLGKITYLGSSSFGLDANGYLEIVDATAPTLTSIADNKDGGPIAAGTTVTYTVTFSEAMNALTIGTADFDIVDGTGTINSVTSVSSSVFLVQVINTTAGNLILRIPTTATITDLIGNALDCDPAITDDTTITVNNSPAPTISAANIANDKAGQPVYPNLLVTYTLTFSEDIDAATVTAEDFGNAGTAAITIGTITETAPGVFTVQVTPTSLGTLQFRVNANAVIRAAASNNVLDTTSAIVDADTNTLVSYLFWDATPGDGATITSGSGTWNTTAGNTVWNNAAGNVPWTQTSTIVGSNHAFFEGTDGTANQYEITVSGSVAAQSLNFSNTGYQLSGGTVSVATSSTTNGNITVAAGKTATINSAINFIDNKATTITSGSGATLNLGGGATNSQYTFAGAGTVNMTAGAYSADVGSVNAATFNQSGGTFNMQLPVSSGGGYFIGRTAGQSVAYNLSGGTLNAIANLTSASNAFLAIGRAAGSTAYSNTLAVSGSGVLNVGTTAGRSGEIQLGYDTTSNGTLNVTGGTVTVGTGTTGNKIYFFKAGSGAGYTANMTQSAGTVTANGIQFGGTGGTYNATSAANLTLNGGVLYVGAEDITRGSGASALPIAIKLQGGTIGASDSWSSALNMQLGDTGGGPTFRAATSGGTSKNITLSGILSNDGAVNGTLTKTGAGTLTLSGSNTFSGGLTINSGTAIVTTTTSALGAGTVTVNNGGSLALNVVGSPTFGQSLTLNNGSNLSARSAATVSNGTLATSGTLSFNNDASATQALTINGASALSGALTVQVGGGAAAPGTVTLSGALSGAGSLVKTGTGQLVLTGSNSFNGLTIKNGTLESKTTQFTLGSGTVTMGGAGSTGATYLTGQSNSNQFVINTPDSGNIVIGTNGVGSGFTMNGGIVLNGNLTMQTFENAINGAIKASVGVVGGVTGSGNLLLNNLGAAANTITFTGGAINHTGSLILSGTAATGDTAIGSVIGANVTSVTQNSATSRLLLYGSNAYTGATSINTGTLALGANNVLPNSSAVSIGTATLDAATFADTAGTLDVTATSTINLGSGATLAFADSSAIDWGSGTLNITGTFVSGTSLRFGTTSGGLTATQLGKITTTGISNFALNESGYLIEAAPEIAVEQPANTGIASGGSQDFGSVEVGSGSNASLTFTVRNSGHLALSLTSTPAVIVGGANANDFTVVANPAATIAAGSTTNFTVTFTPSAEGVRNAALSIANNDSNEGTFVINLSGTGTVVSDPFAAWSGGAAFDADANGDGVSNGLAWILGAADANTNASDLLPSASISGSDIVFTFKRNQESINASTALTVEVGTTLGAWPGAYTVGADTAGSSAGVSVAQDSPSAGTDTVTLTIPRAPDDKKFVRLKAVLTP